MGTGSDQRSKLNQQMTGQTGGATGTPGKRSLTDDEPAKPKAGIPDMFQPIEARVWKSERGHLDQVTAIPGKTDNAMLISAPGIEAEATVKLRDDIDPDPAEVEVGWTQTINSSRRVALYRRPDGKLEGAKITELPPATEDGKSELKEKVPKPWYGHPQSLSKNMTLAMPQANDQPNFPVGTKADHGSVLSEIQGADTFTLTLKARPTGGNLVPLKSFNWSVPWGLKIDNIHGLAKGSPDLGIKDAAHDDPPKVDGKHPKEGGIPLFNDVVEASRFYQDQNIDVFLTVMEQAKTISNESYWNMVGALWKARGHFEVRIMPQAGRDPKGGQLGGDRSRRYSLSGHKHVPIGEGESGTFSALAHMVYDPAALGPGQFINLMVDGMSRAAIDWPFGKEVDTDAIEEVPGFFGNTFYKYRISIKFVK